VKREGLPQRPPNSKKGMGPRGGRGVKSKEAIAELANCWTQFPGRDPLTTLKKEEKT